MRWFSVWVRGVANDLRKPVDRGGVRIFAAVVVLVALSVAAIGFIVVPQGRTNTENVAPRWQIALLCLLFSLPAALLAGGLCVLRRHVCVAERSRGKLRTISRLAIVAGFAVSCGLDYGIPSELGRLIVTAAAVAVIALAWPSIFSDYRRLQPRTAWQRVRWTILTLAIILVVFIAILVELQCAIASEVVQFIVLIAAIAIITFLGRSKIFGNGSG